MQRGASANLRLLWLAGSEAASIQQVWVCSGVCCGIGSIRSHRSQQGGHSAQGEREGKVSITEGKALGMDTKRNECIEVSIYVNYQQVVDVMSHWDCTNI